MQWTQNIISSPLSSLPQKPQDVLKLVFGPIRHRSSFSITVAIAPSVSSFEAPHANKASSKLLPSAGIKQLGIIMSPAWPASGTDSQNRQALPQKCQPCFLVNRWERSEIHLDSSVQTQWRPSLGFCNRDESLTLTRKLPVHDNRVICISLTFRWQFSCLQQNTKSNICPTWWVGPELFETGPCLSWQPWSY